MRRCHTCIVFVCNFVARVFLTAGLESSAWFSFGTFLRSRRRWLVDTSSAVNLTSSLDLRSLQGERAVSLNQSDQIDHSTEATSEPKSAAVSGLHSTSTTYIPQLKRQHKSISDWSYGRRGLRVVQTSFYISGKPRRRTRRRFRGRKH